MCMLCQKLILATAGVEPHVDMRPEGEPEATRDSLHETTYRCLACGTRWLRRTDRWGADAGFRLAP